MGHLSYVKLPSGKSGLWCPQFSWLHAALHKPQCAGTLGYTLEIPSLKIKSETSTSPLENASTCIDVLWFPTKYTKTFTICHFLHVITTSFLDQVLLVLAPSYPGLFLPPSPGPEPSLIPMGPKLPPCLWTCKPPVPPPLDSRWERPLKNPEGSWWVILKFIASVVNIEKIGPRKIHHV